MKKYIKSSVNSYQSSIRHWGKYACYDTVGNRMLECIKLCLPEVSHSVPNIYLNKPIRKFESFTSIVICYTGDIPQLQSEMCQIIRDAAKLERERLYPRADGDSVTYKAITDDSGKGTVKMRLDIQELNTAEVRHTYRRETGKQFKIYKISAVRE